MKKILYFIKLKLSYIFVLDKSTRDYRRSSAKMDWQLAKKYKFEYIDKFGNEDYSNV